MQIELSKKDLELICGAIDHSIIHVTNNGFDEDGRWTAFGVVEDLVILKNELLAARVEQKKRLRHVDVLNPLPPSNGVN